VQSGLPNRASDLVRNITDRHQNDLKAIRREKDGSCFLVPSKLDSEFADRCFNPKTPVEGVPEMIWGDSYAAALWAGVADVPEFRGAKLLEATAASCPPLLHPPTVLNEHCAAVNWRAVAEIRSRRPRVVIMFARWQYYDTHDTDVISSLRETIGALKADGQQLLLVGPNPEWTPSLPQRLFQISFLRGGSIPKRLKDPSHEDGSALDRRMAQLATDMRVNYMSLFASLCNQDGCLTQVDGLDRRDLVDYDHGHMTVPGANWVASHVLSESIAKLRP
jgi:hypothetical protein